MDISTIVLEINIFKESGQHGSFMMRIIDENGTRDFYGRPCKEVVNVLKKHNFIEGSYEIL